MARAPKTQARLRRHKRVRQKISGTAERPRLNVFRSSKHIYAQLIDDNEGHTLVAASSLDPAIKEQKSTGGDCEAARLVGELLAERALEKGINQAVFDRGGYLFHGRVKDLA
ncbi:MAG: 50S ribosomal protein L18, partial [Firmicutes bacterium]|nr:50S ribosomal protein L18 [Bacillota bacterium]